MDCIEQIRNMPQGKNWAARSERYYVAIRRVGAGWEVETGWAVPEGEQDDYMTFTYNPFRKGTSLQPWVGYCELTATAEEAAAMFVRFLADCESKRVPVASTTARSIGSVIRSSEGFR